MWSSGMAALEANKTKGLNYPYLPIGSTTQPFSARISIVMVFEVGLDRAEMFLADQGEELPFAFITDEGFSLGDCRHGLVTKFGIFLEPPIVGGSGDRCPFCSDLDDRHLPKLIKELCFVCTPAFRNGVLFFGSVHFILWDLSPVSFSHRRFITVAYVGTFSINRQRRFNFSHAIRVDPLPPNGSITMASRSVRTLR